MNRVKILLLCFWLQVTFAWAGSVNLKGRQLTLKPMARLLTTHSSTSTLNFKVLPSYDIYLHSNSPALTAEELHFWMINYEGYVIYEYSKKKLAK